MPTPTYDLIQEQVLGSAAASVTFSSIPGTYKDLVLEYVGTGNSADTVYLRYNSDTGNNYSRTFMLGDGTNATSSRATNVSGVELYVTTAQGVVLTSIQSYANTNVNKTSISRMNFAGVAASAVVGLWRNSNAITTIALTKASGTLDVGFTVRLWGVAG